MQTINIRYHFKMPDNKEELIDLHLNEITLDLMNEIPEDLPSWTKINFYQCPHCLLDIQVHTRCPIAFHLVKLLEIFENLLSYDVIHVDVITQQRSVSRETSAQKGVSSIMGLIMAASGCPYMHFFKPMARFHLPLASVEETIYNSASMYLLAQYFLQKEGKKADLELEGLKKIYENIRIVNESMARRLRAISDKEVALNSLVILDIFAQALPFAIEQSLEDARYMFSCYFKESKDKKLKDRG